MVARTHHLFPPSGLQIDLLVTEAQRHAPIAEIDAAHIENPHIEFADLLDIAAGDDEMVEMVDLQHGGSF
jgi:hypothetical protein